MGGGVIGCEFASIFANLGSNVTVVELKQQLLPNEDKEVSKKLKTIFKKLNIKVLVSTDIKSIDLKPFDKVLVCVGRSANTLNSGLEDIGVSIDEKGVVVDEFLKTNIENIFAAGDCTGGLMLAHVAEYEGRLAVENIISYGRKKVDLSVVPNCVFTEPQIASIGINEEIAIAKGYDFKVSRYSFLSNGLSRIMDETEGFIKIISDNKSLDILGAVIMGQEACELINTFSVIIKSKTKLNELKSIIFGHPSIGEGITELS